MPFCRDCGSKLEVNWVVCPSCGVSTQHSEKENSVSLPEENSTIEKKNKIVDEGLVVIHSAPSSHEFDSSLYIGVGVIFLFIFAISYSNYTGSFCSVELYAMIDNDCSVWKMANIGLAGIGIIATIMGLISRLKSD